MEDRTIRMPQIAQRDPLVMTPGGPSVPWPPTGAPIAPDLKRALELAQDAAVRLKHNHVGPVHFLIGIFDEGQGTGARVLRDIGATRDRLEAILAERTGDGGAMRAAELTLIPRAQRVLDIALGKAQRRGRATADTADLLLALANEREHFTVQLLDQLGINPDAVARRLEGQAGESPQG